MVIFDMDGTLVDTRSIILDALNKLSISFKYDALNDADVQQFRSTRSIHFLKVLGIPLWRAPFLIRKIQKILESKMENLELVSGMSDVLLKLKSEGFILGVATSNSKKSADLFFEKFKGKYFDFRKVNIFPLCKYAKLKKIGKNHEIKSENIYYVGDETRDILAAQRAGLSAIAVTWGLNSKEILESMKPSFIADKPADILSFLRDN